VFYVLCVCFKVIVCSNVVFRVGFVVDGFVAMMIDCGVNPVPLLFLLFSTSSPSFPPIYLLSSLTSNASS
jgi:hypothetical protein